MASEWAHATAQAFALWTRVRGSGLRGGRAAFVDGEMGRGGLYTRGCSSKKVWPFYLYSLHRTTKAVMKSYGLKPYYFRRQLSVLPGSWCCNTLRPVCRVPPRSLAYWRLYIVYGFSL